MTLIAADNHLLLWAFLMVGATVSILLEQHPRFGGKIPGAVIALIIGLGASNLGLIPTDAPVYDAVWGYIVPLAIPLLLFQLDMHALFKESGRLLIIFLISSLGTIIGTLAAFALLSKHIPELDKLAGMISASYTGGGVNFAAMTARLEPSQTMTAAAIVADNLMMACYFFILIGVAGSAWVRRTWGSSANASYEVEQGNYWKAKEISLQNIALSFAAAVALVAIAFSVSKAMKAWLGAGDNVAEELLFALVSDKYLLLTSLTLLFITVFRGQSRKLVGSQELGMYGIYLFFVVIGIPASIELIFANAPLLFVFTLIIAVLNLLFTLLVGKLLRFSVEEIVLACNANIGGPTTAAALAISKGWRGLVGPILLVGTVGYIIGNYIGMLVYTLVR
ncbi:MAG: DUF819 family protein [Neisseria sp.]|nr:DUF819 family protein [Neisseria sp.]